MSAFAADFNNVDRLCATGYNMPVIFTNSAGDGFSLATSIWQPSATALTVLSVALSFAAHVETAQVILTLIKNGQTIGAISAGCNAAPTTINFAANNSCCAMQRYDNNGVLMHDNNGNPIYDSASLDRYQLLLTTSAPLRIYGSTLLSWFAGHTTASVV